VPGDYIFRSSWLLFLLIDFHGIASPNYQHCNTPGSLDDSIGGLVRSPQDFYAVEYYCWFRPSHFLFWGY